MPSDKYWEKRAIERLSDAEKQSNEYIKRIKKMYTRANRNIKMEIAKIYKNYSKETGIDIQTLKTLLTKKETDKFWKSLKGKNLKQYVQANYKARINRLEQLQGQLYAKAKEVYGEEIRNDYGAFKGVINDSYYKTIYDTQIGTGYDFTFNKLDNRMIDVLLNEKWSGKNYSERIWKNTDLLANKVSEIVGGALTSGQDMSKTIMQITKAFNVAEYYAERLVRTETNHFNAEAEALAYEELNVKKYVFVATLDNRTSEICQSLDNKVFEFSKRKAGENFPPMHPNCRSTYRAYMGEEEEKLLKRRAKNPDTEETEIIDNISYEEWKKKSFANETENNIKLTDDEQLAINKYISSDFYIINEKIRNNIPLIESEEKLCYDLDKALDKIPNYKGDLTRSLELSDKELMEFLEKHPKNKTVVYSAYTSTTKGERYNTNSNVEIYILDAQKGKNLSMFNSGEQEVLYKRGSKFKVKDIEKLNTTYHLLLEEM